MGTVHLLFLPGLVSLLSSGYLAGVMPSPVIYGFCDGLDGDVSDVRYYVGATRRIDPVQYAPRDLVIVSGSHLMSDRRMMIRAVASDSLQQLASGYSKKFAKPLEVVSAYRSYDYQKDVISEACKKEGLCAYEGYSEHQLGLAIDVLGATNNEKFLRHYPEEYTWLQVNARRYGWTQSYQKLNGADGYAPEPWHWRYVGVDTARVLYRYGMTLTDLWKMCRE